MFGKILCPVDFSASSQAALRVAARLAAANGSELVVAHAWHFPTVAAASETQLPGTTIELAKQDEKHALRAALEQARALGASKVTERFLEGSPVHQFVDLAASDRSFDLIVMGTHGRTGFKRFIMGSVAEQVVRHAPISVLVVRGNPDGPHFDHVLCPIDGTDASSVVERAESLANPSGTGLDLMHVIELPLAATGDPLLTDLINHLDRHATGELERYQGEVTARRKLPVRSEVLTGNPAEQMLAKLEEDRTFDLVAIGTHGRTGIRRLLLGSVAEKLVRHSPCSVLVVRARA